MTRDPSRQETAASLRPSNNVLHRLTTSCNASPSLILGSDLSTYVLSCEMEAGSVLVISRNQFPVSRRTSERRGLAATSILETLPGSRNILSTRKAETKSRSSTTITSTGIQNSARLLHSKSQYC